MVTANYKQSSKLTQAQIDQLEVERINVKGIIEASIYFGFFGSNIVNIRGC